MFNSIFDYVDKLISIIKPKKLLYLAIDGVAPRAKMNQQRSRRFRAALEANDYKEKTNHLVKEWRQKGLTPPKTADDSFHFDSNTITPGTTFMERLGDALKVNKPIHS